MTGGISLGRYFGFEIRIDPSWFVIFFLVLWTFAQMVFPAQYPDLRTATHIGMGVAGAVLFFISVLLHELAHSAVARTRGIDIEGITLFIFGGMARTRQEPETPKDEFLLTAAGPVSSVLIGLALLGIAVAGRAGGWPVALIGVADYLSFLNFVLAGFNLVPGLPLDGGRLLRSAVWAWTGDLRKATRWASLAGRGFGFTLIGLGVVFFFGGNIINGMWFVFIGWFLSQAAQASYRQLILRRILEGVRAREAMTRDPETVQPGLTLQELVDEFLMRRRYSAFPVLEDGGALVGMITLSKVKEVDRSRWGSTRVGDVMVRLEDAPVVEPDDALTDVISAMEDAGMGRALVMEGGRLTGLITRSDISQWLERYQQLN